MARLQFYIVLSLPILLLFISGCGGEPKTVENAFDVSIGSNSLTNMSMISLTTSSGSHNFSVEVASSEADKEKGLMNRKTFDKNAGMLFIYNNQDIRGFWMRNTLIPLDMIFIDGNLTIVDINKNAQPCVEGQSCRSYYSKAPAQYVLEINGGLSDELGIGIGNRLVA